MVKALRRSAPKPKPSRDQRQFRAWSQPLEMIGHELDASRERFMMVGGDPNLMHEARDRRLLVECQRWRDLAARVQRLTPPPIAEPAHKRAVAGFMRLADWGERLTAVTATTDATKIEATVNEMETVWADVDHDLGEASTLAANAAQQLVR